MLMVESLASITWQETVDTAVARLEAHTGLALAGLSQSEISLQVREWTKAKAQEKLIAHVETGGGVVADSRQLTLMA